MSERLDQHAFELLVATVAATLAMHLGHLPIWLSLPLAAVLALRVWSRRRGAAQVGAWIRLPLTALLVVLVVANFGNLFGREPGSALACGLLALKLLETERVRDARVAVGFAAFVLMSALLFTQTLVFTFAVCAGAAAAAGRAACAAAGTDGRAALAAPRISRRRDPAGPACRSPPPRSCWCRACPRRCGARPATT